MGASYERERERESLREKESGRESLGEKERERERERESLALHVSCALCKNLSSRMLSQTNSGTQEEHRECVEKVTQASEFNPKLGGNLVGYRKAGGVELPFPGSEFSEFGA